jgi:small-conductance mechanosensitive channel
MEKSDKMRLVTTTITILTLLVLIAATVVAAIYVPQVAVYVPIIALGLALALQKYTASFIAFFVIEFTRVFEIGDRIRIGNVKGDVRHVGIIHIILEEVGEDEKLGGELTGRLLYVPNLVILDQPVLNYSKGYFETIPGDYVFDEVRIPITSESNVPKASDMLEKIIKNLDEPYIAAARKAFKKGSTKFVDEATGSPRVLVHIEPQRIWIKGKFVAPLRKRNDLRSEIMLQFLKEINGSPDIKLA